jgi:hypothetical protein
LGASIVDVPEVAAAIMSARWDIDLSPATRTSPRKAPA